MTDDAQDAKRYRWLKENEWFIEHRFHTVNDGDSYYDVSFDGIDDEAIDAAMQKATR